MAAAHHLLKEMDQRWKASVSPGTASSMQKHGTEPQKTALEQWSFSGLLHRIASGVEAGVANAMGQGDAYEKNNIYKTIEQGDAAASASNSVMRQVQKQQQLVAGQSKTPREAAGFKATHQGILTRSAQASQAPHPPQQVRVWDPIKRRFETKDTDSSKKATEEPFLFRLAMGEIHKDEATPKVAPTSSEHHVQEHLALHRPLQPPQRQSQFEHTTTTAFHQLSHLKVSGDSGEQAKVPQHASHIAAKNEESKPPSQLAREAERQQAYWRKAVSRWKEEQQTRLERKPQQHVQQLPIRVQVTVPPGAKAGNTLQVKAHGKSFPVTIPRGKVPGDTFSTIVQDQQQQLRLSDGESVVKMGTLNAEDGNGVMAGVESMGGVKADDEHDSGVASGLGPIEDENDSGVTSGINKMGAASSEGDSGVMSDFAATGSKTDDSSLNIGDMMKESAAQSDVPDPFGGSDGGIDKLPPAPDPFAGMDGMKMVPKHVPDPFAGHDGMGGDGKLDMNLNDASTGDDDGVFGEMRHTQEAMKGFKPTMPPSIANPETAGFGGLPTSPDMAGFGGLPTSPRTPLSGETPSDPFGTDKNEYAEAVDKAAHKAGEEEADEQRKVEDEEEYKRDAEREEEVIQKKKEEKEEEAQEAIDARDGGPLSLPPPPSASSIHSVSATSTGSVDSLGTFKSPTPQVPDPFKSSKEPINLENQAPDPFAGYDGMGGMTKQPHTEDPSVFGEMQKTYHKDAMKDFKPSMPPSIAHPHSSGIGGLPADVRKGLTSSPPRSYGAPAAAGESPSAEAESSPFSAPDPLQEGGSGIASVYGYGEDTSAEQQEREAQQEEGAVYEVKMAVSLPYTEEEFDDGLRNTFKASIAKVAEVASRDVSIVKIGSLSGARRRLLAAGIRVDVAVKASDRSASIVIARELNAENINAALEEAGLKEAVIVEPPLNVETTKEAEQAEAKQERAAEAAEKAEEVKEEKEEEAQEAIDARDGGPLSLPPPPSAREVDDSEPSRSSNSADSFGDVKQIVPDAPGEPVHASSTMK